MENGSVFENDFIKLEMSDGIVFGWYKAGPITLDLAKKAVEYRLAFTNNKPVKMIATEEGLKGIERDARQYLSSDKGMEGLIAGAIVTKTVFSSHLANIYMKISLIKPKIPMRMFSNEEDAVNWLKNL